MPPCSLQPEIAVRGASPSQLKQNFAVGNAARSSRISVRTVWAASPADAVDALEAHCGHSPQLRTQWLFAPPAHDPLLGRVRMPRHLLSAPRLWLQRPGLLQQAGLLRGDVFRHRIIHLQGHPQVERMLLPPRARQERHEFLPSVPAERVAQHRQLPRSPPTIAGPARPVRSLTA